MKNPATSVGDGRRTSRMDVVFLAEDDVPGDLDGSLLMKL